METTGFELEEKIYTIFETQKQYQHTLKQRSADYRQRQLKKLKKIILESKEEIIQALQTDNSKPAFESLSVEIYMLIHEIDYVCANLQQWMTPQIIVPGINPTARAEIVYEPRGVVLIIGPWNYPFALSIGPLIPAIAAGNVSILKPSELTPATSKLISRLITENFDPQEIAVVEGGIKETTILLKLPFDHIFFTGSSKVGKVVMKAAAKNLASITLELGGKSPAIISKDADLEKAVTRILKGKTVNAGQICLSPDYVLIPKCLEESFIRLSKIYIEESYYKNGKFNYSDYSQIINQKNYDRLKLLFDDAVEKGATVALGGFFDKANLRIHPTILSNVPENALIMHEEIFGPIVPLINYNTNQQAIDLIRKKDKPLSVYIFSNSEETIDYFIKNTASGGITVNDSMMHAAEMKLPFGGVNGSGTGSYHGKAGFEELSHRKSIFYQNPETPADRFGVPPYEGKYDLFLETILKM